MSHKVSYVKYGTKMIITGEYAVSDPLRVVIDLPCPTATVYVAMIKGNLVGSCKGSSSMIEERPVIIF